MNGNKKAIWPKYLITAMENSNMSHSEFSLLLASLNISNDSELNDNELRKVSIERMQLLNFVTRQVLLPIICMLGIVGNSINMVVFVKRWLNASTSRTHLEHTVTISFIALASVDLLVCIAYFPLAFEPDSHRKSLLLEYQVYGPAILNIVLMCSVWYTMTMTICRYVAVCRPLQARWVLSARRVLLIIVLLSSIAIIVSIPIFFKYKIVQESCVNHTTSNSCQVFEVDRTDLFTKHSFRFAYRWLMTMLNNVIPFIILLVCNTSLICTHRRSLKLRREMLLAAQSRVKLSSKLLNSPTSRSTLTPQTTQTISMSKQEKSVRSPLHDTLSPLLVALTIVFLILMVPSETTNFICVEIIEHKLKPALDQNDKDRMQYVYTNSYLNTLIMMANLGKVINCAVNCLLYCMVSRSFRCMMSKTFCKKDGDEQSRQQQTFLQSTRCHSQSQIFDLKSGTRRSQKTYNSLNSLAGQQIDSFL